jgi:hypothetical protein
LPTPRAAIWRPVGPVVVQLPRVQPFGKICAVPRQNRLRPSIALSERRRKFLEARGARTDRGRGPYGFTNQFKRSFDFFDSIVVRSDPRMTLGMAKKDYELVLEVLTDAHELDSFRISWLGRYLLELPAFHDLARKRKLDPERFADTLDGFPFAEKLHLVDMAQQRHSGSRRS